MARNEYAQGVFINCPFDSDYKPIFEATVFSVIACGFRPRCALEIDDSSEVRIDKIFKIIAECKLGIHDISRTELTSAGGLPRFNMPLELGMFLAAKRFGSAKQKQKICLILDSMPYRYQQFISDIAGQDIQVHNNSAKEAISVVRNWLRSASGLGLILILSWGRSLVSPFSYTDGENLFSRGCLMEDALIISVALFQLFLFADLAVSQFRSLVC
jgi:hypothetical protein